MSRATSIRFASVGSPPDITQQPAVVERASSWQVPAQLAAVFLAYFVAGKLGQATTNIRSSNLGPVWPAYGVALAAFLMYGARIWPAIAGCAFIVAAQSAVSPLAAAGQAFGATVSALTGARLLRRIPDFDPSLSRLRDALGFVAVGAFGSALLSSSIGILALYTTGIQPYSGLTSAWLIYWLGDSTGVLLVTPLVFTLPQLLRIRSGARVAELAVLVALLTGVCFVIFGDLPLIPVRLHALAFVVVPFVMWAAIDFGIAGSALAVFLIATIATLLTALGFGPFSANTPFVNAVLLDVLFAVLAVSGLALAAVIAERERSEKHRERLVRDQAGVEARLRLAAIVESSADAIFSTDMDEIILSWNAAAQRIFGYTAAEAIGQSAAMLYPPERGHEADSIRQKLNAGEPIVRLETIRRTKQGERVDSAITISPLRDAAGRLVGAARITRDISEQKRATEALSHLSRSLIEAQEQERARIGRELHDDIGQRLALLASQLTMLADGPLRSPAHQQAITLQRQASELAADVQTLSHTLHSAKLELLGLASAMVLFCREFSDRQDVRIDFEPGEMSSDLPANVSLTLFRILQEAVHNSVKHAGVRHCHVRLFEADGWVHLRVEDQGVGFDVGASRTGRGIGLLSMEERIKLVAGKLSIASQPGRGTAVHVRVPVVVPQDPRIS